MTPNVGAFPDEVLEDKLDKEDMEKAEEAESDIKLKGGHVNVSPDINEIICGELHDAISDLWGEETNSQLKVAADWMNTDQLPLEGFLDVMD